MAFSIPGAIGFTRHGDFFDDDECRFASAVISYTNLSPPEKSWDLFLFDENEA